MRFQESEHVERKETVVDDPDPAIRAMIKETDGGSFEGLLRKLVKEQRLQQHGKARNTSYTKKF